ncbi:MAG TPA: hypothetical protein VMV25_03875 [Steroidobacteraceae bacterium]|nr:hypothetical protein [Steroidobacteraceae bacterium]
MSEEIRNISDDHEALRWSLGCLQAGYSERMQIIRLLDFWIVRCGLAFWIALQALSGIFDGIFVLSYKFHALGITQFLGLRTEGDDYRRFIPLMNGTPVWGSIASLLASALYLAALVQVLRRRRSATGLFFAGLVLSVGLWVKTLATPAVEAFSPAHLKRDALLYVITALLGLLLWEGGKAPRQRTPQP